MAGRRPDFIVHSAVGALGPRRRRELGVAFWNERKDGLIVLLDAVPMSGKLMLSKWEPSRTETGGHDDARPR
jgi:hypothetical protein